MRLTRQSQGLPALGGADGEPLGAGLLVQPVNSLSSLGLVVAGAAVAALAWRRNDADRGEAALFGGALAAAGLGSVDYHGPQTHLAQWGHDMGIVAALATMAAHSTGVLAGWSPPVRNGVLAATVGVSGAAAVARPEAAMATAAGLGAVAAVAEAMRLKDDTPRQRRWLGLSAGALGLGLVAYVAGRSGGPAAHPSPVRGHAAWHLLTALALGAWGVARLVPPPAPRPARPFGPRPATVEPSAVPPARPG